MKGKVLIVDDDANIREGVGDILDAEGYEIAQAGSTAEALAQVRAASFDVILMDYNLTDGNGIDAIRQIRQVNADSQILMITGNASLDTAVKAIQESVDDFLTKPVGPDLLKRAIAKSLEKMKLRQENRRLIEDLRKALLVGRERRQPLLDFGHQRQSARLGARLRADHGLLDHRFRLEQIGLKPELSLLNGRPVHDILDQARQLADAVADVDHPLLLVLVGGDR